MESHLPASSNLWKYTEEMKTLFKHAKNVYSSHLMLKQLLSRVNQGLGEQLDKDDFGVNLFIHYTTFNASRYTLMKEFEKDGIKSLDDLMDRDTELKNARNVYETHKQWNRNSYISLESMIQSITQRPMQLKTNLE